MYVARIVFLFQLSEYQRTGKGWRIRASHSAHVHESVLAAWMSISATLPFRSHSYTLARVIRERRSGLARRSCKQYFALPISLTLKRCGMTHWLADAGPRALAPPRAVAVARALEVQANTLFSAHPPSTIDALEDLEGDKYCCTVMGSSNEFFLKC